MLFVTAQRRRVGITGYHDALRISPAAAMYYAQCLENRGLLRKEKSSDGVILYVITQSGQENLRRKNIY
jgi:hypothetical protein